MPAGRTIALVGATGSGKTSLVSLIPRLYDASEGDVLVDGANVREVDLHSLRHAVAVVSDDPFLFSATVAENIAYARPQATQQEIELAARRAQAQEFIADLPDGMQTRVGERGLSLSGGQRQRLAIARALLADPRVLILDDATSSVDSSTERLIKLALDEAMAGRTTFIIAHRLSTIALADEIVVLDHGQIIAQGNHDQLLQSSELYREIVEKGMPDQVFLTLAPTRARGERPVSAQGGRGGGGGRGVGPGLGRRGSQWDGERASKENRGRNLRGLLELLRPYRLRVVCMLGALLLGTVALLASPLLARLAIDEGIERHDTRRLVLVVIAFLISALLVWLMTYIQTYLVGWVGQRALADLRIRIFTHLQRQPIGFYESRPAGVLISRITNDVEALESLVTDSVVTLFQSALTLVGAIAVLLYLDPKLALITFCIVPFVAGASIWFRLASTGAFRRTRETIATITAYLQETLSGIRVVRSFGQESMHEAQFAAFNEDNREANMVTVRLNAAYFPAVEMLAGVALALIVLYGGLQAIEGHATAGTIVAFVATLTFLFEPIQQLSQFYTTYQSGMAALEKIFQLLDVQPVLEDRPGAVDLPRIRGDIQFDHISFAYDQRGSPAPNGHGRDGDGHGDRESAERAAGAGAPTTTAAAMGANGGTANGNGHAGGSRSPRAASRAGEGGNGAHPVLALSGVDLHMRRARRWRSSAPPEPASRRWRSCWRASMTRPSDACSSTATTCAISRAPRFARRWGSCPRRRSCSLARSERTSPSAAPMPTISRSAQRRRRSASTS